MNKKEKKKLVDKIWELKKWLEDKLADKNLLSHSFGINISLVDRKDDSYCVYLRLDDYRTRYVRYCDFGIRRKKFLESLVGEELEYFVEKYVGMTVRLEERHIERLFLLRRIYD